MEPIDKVLREWMHTESRFTAEDRAVFAAGEQARADREAARAGWTPDQGPYPEGPPSDWLHDGSEANQAAIPGYRCHVCNDAGWVRCELPVGHPEFGRAVRCRCQTEDPALRAHATARRLRVSFIPPALEGKTLATFRAVAGTHRALDGVRHWQDRFDHGGEPGWLVLSGAPGCGKSHLLAALATHVLLTTPLQWIDTPAWVRRCAEDHFAGADDFLRLAHQAPVLALDEFGSQQAGDWGRTQIETLLGARYTARQPTLIGLTCNPDELAAWSPRLASRLQDRSLVRFIGMTAPDYRPQLKGEDTA